MFPCAVDALGRTDQASQIAQFISARSVSERAGNGKVSRGDAVLMDPSKNITIAASRVRSRA